MHMTIATSKVTARGQVSLPAEVRRLLGISPSSLLKWEQEGDKIIVQRAGQYSSEDLHHALFEVTPQPRNLEEMKEGIRDCVTERHARR